MNQIKQLIHVGVPCKDIAEYLGISYAYVMNMANGHTPISKNIGDKLYDTVAHFVPELQSKLEVILKLMEYRNNANTES